MRRRLHDWFVPHEGNGHRPYLLRNEIALALIVIAGIGQVLFLAELWHVRKAGLVGDISSSVLVSQTNRERAEDGLGTLATNPLLQAAAQAKADDMAAKSYFAHQSPDGRQPWDWIKAAGYRYHFAGENLAVNFVESSDVTQAWMNSPEHRANLLSDHYTEIGIAMAQGTYKGQAATFVVQMFGSPAATAPVAQKPSEPATEAPAARPVLSAPKKVVAAIQPILPQATVAASPTSTSQETATATDPTDLAPATQLPIAVALASEDASPAAAGTSPKRMLLTFYALLAALVGLAVVIKVAKVRLRHPQLVLNGVLVLILIAGMAWLSEYATLAHAFIG